MNSLDVLQVFLLYRVSIRAPTTFGFPKHYRRIFTANDVKDLLEDREQVAADLLKMKHAVASLLTRYRNNPDLDTQVVMTQLERLMDEIES